MQEIFRILLLSYTQLLSSARARNISLHGNVSTAADDWKQMHIRYGGVLLTWRTQVFFFFFYIKFAVLECLLCWLGDARYSSSMDSETSIALDVANPLNWNIAHHPSQHIIHFNTAN